MNDKNTKYLLKNYPELYRQYGLPMTETCMCWGFPGDGWLKILNTMSKKITAYAKKNNIIVEATQVKEKFGTLRVYLSQSNSIIDEMVQEAEIASAKTCEVCGKPGKMGNRGSWISVRCPKCRKDEKK